LNPWRASLSIGLAAVVTVAAGLLWARPASATTTVNGVVHTLAADTVDRSADPRIFHGHSKDIYRKVLVVGSNSYFLKGKTAPNNAHVRVKGDIVGHDFNATSITTLGTVAGLADTGTTRVLVMLAYWTAPDSVTQASASNQLFVDSNGWYRDASYTALGQTGDVTPWMAIAGPATGCYADHMTLMSQAKTASSNLGYDMASYDNFVLYFPYCSGDSAGYAGWAYIDSTGTWLNGFMDRRVTVHEQGHNYGLYHSHSYMCSGGGLDGSCTFSDYGDLYDAMGSSSYVGHFNASQKTILGWMNGRTVDLSTGGTATLAPAADDSTSPHAAVVAMSSGRKYWLEYRQPIDFDSWLPSSGTDGVLIHVSGSGSGSTDDGASLIDVRASDGISQSTSTLLLGQSWTSPDGVTFSVGAVNAAGATVTVGTGPTSNTLSVTKSGTGSGTVTSQPAGISCGSTCSASFPSGASVTLTATAAAGSTFAGWAGACSGTSTCTLSITTAQSVAATFNASTGGTTTQEWAPAVTLDGWRGLSDGSGTYRVSKVANNTATFKFSGTSVTWVTRKGPAQGIASVTIDGVSKGTFDTYGASWQVFKQSFTGLTSTTHKIVVKCLGTKNAASTNTNVAVDAFMAGSATTQETSPKILYDTWTGGTSASASGGTYRSNPKANATSTFSFTGTAVDWITAVGPGYGKAQVYIDGANKGAVDLYSATTHWQTAKPYTGLSLGTHTIMIKVLGAKNGAATSTRVVIDAFVVH
jgi:hypothetical protein